VILVEDGKRKASPKGAKKNSLMETIQLIILAIGFSIMLGSIMSPNGFRPAIAEIVNTIVHPIASNMPFYIVVLVIAGIVTTISTFIQKYTMDWELMQRVSAKSRAYSKEMKEAQLSGNKVKMKKLQEEQLTMMDDQAAMSKQQLKPMGFLMIISLPLFFWMLWYVTGHPELPLINLPLLGTHKLTDSVFILQYWILWSVICSMAISQVIRKVINVGVPT